MYAYYIFPAVKIEPFLHTYTDICVYVHVCWYETTYFRRVLLNDIKSGK